MHQVTQKLKDGEMRVLEVPFPSLEKGQVLIRNHYSLISAGTEGSTVKAAKKGYIGKAKDRPQQVKKAIANLQTQGIVQTYRSVMKKLEAHSRLGYSCAGEVIDVAMDVKGFKIGDLVACGGLTASHSEVVSVPANLCVRLKRDADLKLAAYNTVGAIAIQGVRRADLRLGETCAVIGLGLIGQLTALLLRASGVKAIGIDIEPSMVEISREHCLDLALCRDDSGIEQKIMQFTGGLGCDAVIITAATSSLDPINFAGAISRKKGTIVVVGAVPTGFDRGPHYYSKELQVKMSCSYGPGRYDPIYEEKGLDYPPAYVRWTENRNMQTFQDLVYSRKIDIDYLTSHSFKLESAPAAYDMMIKRSEPFIGIIIEYDVAKTIKRGKIAPKKVDNFKPKEKAVSIGFIGAGSYAQSLLLPNIPKARDISLKGVITASGTSSRSVVDRYGFEFCTDNESDILENDDINTIFVVTRHNAHAEFVIKGLAAGKNVFVEKPLCLNNLELEEIKKIYSLPEKSHQILMVGYNRRFSPLAKTIKEKLGNGPMSMMYRINAGYVPPESWVHDAEIGGGRIIGEVCHFIDFLTFVNGSLPTSVYATALRGNGSLDDIVNISLTYENGSIGSISYYSNGDPSLPKEHVEISASGTVMLLNDYKILTTHESGKTTQKKLISQDKGQKAEIKEFINAIRTGGSQLIPFEELFSTSLVTFKIMESLKTGQSMEI